MVQRLHHKPVLVNECLQVVPFVVRIEGRCPPLPHHVHAVGLQKMVQTRDEGSRCLTQVERIETCYGMRYDVVHCEYLVELRPALRTELWLELVSDIGYDIACIGSTIGELGMTVP